MIFKLLRQQTSIVNFSRQFSQSEILCQQSKQASSGLYALRKSTGYALNKCREALEKHNGDIQAATKWLNEQAQKEGWAKAEKLKNRATSQGALTLHLDRTQNRAVLVEINCETDFVAKNEKFLNLSSNIALSVHRSFQSQQIKNFIQKEELNKLGFIDGSKTIGDELALAIGTIGENMSIRRAVVLNLPQDQYLSWYMHGSITDSLNNCHFGRFGALVSTSLKEKNENYKPFDIGRQIAQHIVGMNPTSLGELPAPPSPSGEPVKIDENETRLLHQEFLMKPGVRVFDFLNENHTVLNDFVRFECGETLESDPK